MMTNFEKLNKIFIADDEEINLKYFKRFLSVEYEVYTTENCLDGLNLVKVFNPDIILLDVHMPGINGFEFCKILKLDEETKNIPVIFISSLANPEHIKTGLKVGAIDFISKPINKTETLARIKTHLAMGQVQRELAHSNKILDTSLKVAEQKFNVEKDHREKISARLIESENRFKLIFDSSPEAIIIVSVDSGEIIDANNACCSLFGYSYNELICANQNDLLESSKEIIEKNYFAAQGDTQRGSDVRMLLNNLIRKDGTRIHFQNYRKTI
jgi:PAS domain S-box-containing protein